MCPAELRVLLASTLAETMRSKDIAHEAGWPTINGQVEQSTGQGALAKDLDKRVASSDWSATLDNASNNESQESQLQDACGF